MNEIRKPKVSFKEEFKIFSVLEVIKGFNNMDIIISLEFSIDGIMELLILQ